MVGLVLLEVIWKKTICTETCIMSYSLLNFAPLIMAPFRDAIGASSHKPIDKSGYQLSPNNFRNESIRELELDFEEGRYYDG